MSKMVQTGEFFVVGGSVQGDRASYIERAADDELYEALQQGEFCYVLEPRAAGKSSLMGRAARRLREEGQLAAVVDLTQIGARERDATAGRWYYSIAYRIVRELRLKVDLQGWWQERSLLSGERRLIEFLRDIVLANTTGPVCIFIDDVELLVQADFAPALFASIKNCYRARVAEPEYGRLNFVMLGSASPRELCGDPETSPFEAGHRVVLEDFTLDELQQLAPGFGVDMASARVLLARIFMWTAGQPYLTQKLARQVARAGANGVDEASVDQMVRERLLAPTANRAETLFNHIRAVLTAPSPYKRQALAILGRVCKGMITASDLDSPAQNLLRLSGLIIDSPDGQLILRNRIYEQVFSTRWVSSVLPFEWRGFAMAGVAVSLLIMVPLWYFQVLPRADLRTLSQADVDVPAAVAAYDSLRALPGFAATAQRLLADGMTRRSQDARDFSVVMKADQALRRVPGLGPRADELLSEYWYRRAQQAADQEDRDAALIFSLAGLGAVADTSGRALLGELIDSDYESLDRTLRVPGAIASWVMDWQSRQLTVVDEAHRAFRYGADSFQSADIGRLSALQYIPVARDVVVDETGSVGAFELVVDLDHPAPAQLRLTLQSPDGAVAALSLANQTVQRSGRLRVRSRGTPLTALADSPRQGVWRLELVDETEGDGGRLVRWSLSFSSDGEIWTDTPESGLAIPNPIRTDQIQVQLSDNGLLAAAVPARDDSIGAVTLWDLEKGSALADLRLESAQRAVGFAAAGTRLYTMAGNNLTLWDTARASPVARIATANGFTLPPAASADGGYLMVAEAIEGAAPLFSLLRASDGRLLATSEGSSQARDWVLGPEARYLAVVESDRLVRLFNPRRSGALASLAHSQPIDRVIVLAGEQGVITTDNRGVIRHWLLPDKDAGEAEFRRLGVTRDSGTVTVRSDRLAYLAMDYSVVVRALDTGAVTAMRPGADQTLELALAPDGQTLMTRSGSLLRAWRLNAGNSGAQALASVASDGLADRAVLGDLDGNVSVVSRTSSVQLPVPDGSDLQYLGHSGPITALALDSGRELAVSGGSDGLVRFWDLRSGAPTESFLRHPQGPINAVALSEDGRWMASSAEYATRLWQVGDDQLSGEIPVNGAALAVVFSPDSKRVVTGDSAGNVWVADPEIPLDVQTWRAAEPIAALAVSPDARWVASGGQAGTVEFWNLADGSVLAAPLKFPSAIRALSFSADGQQLVVQTVSWYHLVSLAGAAPERLDSRLAPLGAAPLSARPGSGGRLVKTVVVGRELAFRDLDVGRPNAAPIPGDVQQLMERWQRAVGLAVNSAGEVAGLPLVEPVAADLESVN